MTDEDYKKAIAETFGDVRESYQREYERSLLRRVASAALSVRCHFSVSVPDMFPVSLHISKDLDKDVRELMAAVDALSEHDWEKRRAEEKEEAMAEKEDKTHH